MYSNDVGAYSEGTIIVGIAMFTALSSQDFYDTGFIISCSTAIILDVSGSSAISVANNYFGPQVCFPQFNDCSRWFLYLYQTNWDCRNCDSLELQYG